MYVYHATDATLIPGILAGGLFTSGMPAGRHGLQAGASRYRFPTGQVEGGGNRNGMVVINLRDLAYAKIPYVWLPPQRIAVILGIEHPDGKTYYLPSAYLVSGYWRFTSQGFPHFLHRRAIL